MLGSNTIAWYLAWIQSPGIWLEYNHLVSGLNTIAWYLAWIQSPGIWLEYNRLVSGLNTIAWYLIDVERTVRSGSRKQLKRGLFLQFWFEFGPYVVLTLQDKHSTKCNWYALDRVSLFYLFPNRYLFWQTMYIHIYCISNILNAR